MGSLYDPWCGVCADNLMMDTSDNAAMDGEYILTPEQIRDSKNVESSDDSESLVTCKLCDTLNLRSTTSMCCLYKSQYYTKVFGWFFHASYQLIPSYFAILHEYIADI